jgi:(p)ppGpp synthase/HD superfamily hydrolase
MQPNGGRVSAKNPTSTTYSKSPNWSPPLVEIQEAIIAALLHDAIKDQKIWREMIAEQFSEPVARIVLEVTDDKLLPWQERKASGTFSR